MKKTIIFSFMTIALLFLSGAGCERAPDPDPVFGEMTDLRDGQTYKTVTLGDQTWLGRNLNYETDDNSWCYDNDPAICSDYGRLYDWEAAMTACPDGWHLASDEDWSTLIKYLDPKADPDALPESAIAGGILKGTGTIEDGTGLWRSPNTAANNTSGFSAEPGGARYEDGTFVILGMHVIYWTSTEYDENSAWFRIMDYGIGDIYRDNSNLTKGMGVSVRCVED